jgi:hypothetical protein
MPEWIIFLFFFNCLVIALLVYQVLKKYVFPKLGVQPKPIRPKELFLILIPQIVVLAGAIVTRYSGHILPALPISVILAIGALILISFFTKELKNWIPNGNISALIILSIKSLISFSVTYFGFIFVLYGFDFEKMKTLAF